MKKVGIFAGHNENTYNDYGSKGIETKLTETGYYEEFDSNIVIAENLAKRLGAYSEIEVHFPQADGRNMTLWERKEYCNHHGLDTVIFIHSNASSSPGAKGAAAFYWYNSPEGEKFANFYAAEMRSAGFPLWSDGTYPCEPGTWSDFYVVKKTAMPVLLTENFFFTNPEELKNYLLDPDALDKIAEVHEKATCKYLGIVHQNTKFRLVTGTFEERDDVEQAAQTLRDRFGWVVYIKEEEN